MRFCFFCLTIGFWGVLLAGCGAPSMSLPTAEQLVAHEVAGNVDPGTLKRGRALALKDCSNCHRFYYPEEYPPQAWPKIIRSKGKRLLLNRKQTEELLHYFQLSSKASG